MQYSIVVPVYNVERWLSECLESIESQTLDSWEAVLVNDGSTDGSLDICNQFKEKHPERVIVISQENQGLLMARRRGFKAARGDVLISLDSDDALREDALEEINAAFSAYHVDMVMYGCTRKPDFSSFDSHELFNNSRFIPESEKTILFKKLCNSSALNSMAMKAVKRGAINIDADYSQYMGLCYAEDLLQTLDIIDLVRSAYYIHKPLYYYRVNYESLTKRFNPEHLKARDRVRKQHLERAREWEKQSGDATLVSGVCRAGVASYAQMAQAASEGLTYSKACEFMAKLSASRQFSLYWAGFRKASLRVDYGIISVLLKYKLFGAIWVFCQIKGATRKMLGR